MKYRPRKLIALVPFFFNSFYWLGRAKKEIQWTITAEDSDLSWIVTLGKEERQIEGTLKTKENSY